MLKKLVSIAVILIMFSPGNIYSMPFQGESQLLIDSGITDNPKDVSPKAKDASRFKDTFLPGKNIIFWATVLIKSGDIMQYLLSADWYGPDGRIWYKENKQLFGSSSLMFGGEMQKTAEFKLDTKTIPSDKQGVWAVRLSWNNGIISEHYFTYSDNSDSPSIEQIDSLKKKMKQYDRSIAFSNRSNYYKLSSHLAYDTRKLYKQQEVFEPDFVFAPDEQIVYTLNYDSTEFGLYSQVPRSNIYLFSPDGKLQKILGHQWMYGQASPLVCGFKEKIDFKKLIGDNKNLYGLWKLIVYIPIVNQNFDERYFYVGGNKSTEITKDMVDSLDKKINEDDIIKSLNWMVAMDRDKAISQGRKNNDRCRIDVGMTKDEVYGRIGKPQKIITDRYDDALVWVYTSVSEGAKDPAYSVSATNAVSRNTNLGTGLIAGGVVTGLCLLMPNKLELVIKDDIVVSVKGSV